MHLIAFADSLACALATARLPSTFTAEFAIDLTTFTLEHLLPAPVADAPPAPPAHAGAAPWPPGLPPLPPQPRAASTQLPACSSAAVRNKCKALQWFAKACSPPTAATAGGRAAGAGGGVPAATRAAAARLMATLGQWADVDQQPELPALATEEDGAALRLAAARGLLS